MRYQRSDEEAYDAQNTISLPFLLLFGNSICRTSECREIWSLPELTDSIDLTGVNQRSIHDVTVKSINVFYCDIMPLNGSEPIIKCSISAAEGTDDFYNINISDISVNGKKVNYDCYGGALCY